MSRTTGNDGLKGMITGDLSEAGSQTENPSEQVVIPVIEEQVEIGKRVVETGRVRIHKTVTERTEVVSEPMTRENVEIERVRIDRYVDGPVEARTEGDTLIVPVLEEILVVEKRLMLREEIRITKRLVATAAEPTTVTLRREEVEVERLDAPEERGATRR